MIEDQDDVGAPASGSTRRPELLCADDDADMAADARNALSGTTLLPNTPDQSPRMLPNGPVRAKCWRCRSTSHAGGQARFVLDEVPEPVGHGRGDGRPDVMLGPTSPDTTSVLRPSSRARPVEDPRERLRLRLRLKPKARPPAGWTVGGGRDRGILAAELPSLL
jgi:hypothetical protein